MVLVSLKDGAVMCAVVIADWSGCEGVENQQGGMLRGRQLYANRTATPTSSRPVGADRVAGTAWPHALIGGPEPSVRRGLVSYGTVQKSRSKWTGWQPDRRHNPRAYGVVPGGPLRVVPRQCRYSGMCLRQRYHSPETPALRRLSGE